MNKEIQEEIERVTTNFLDDLEFIKMQNDLSLDELEPINELIIVTNDCLNTKVR